MQYIRRTANTSVSPTIGIVVAGTGKIGFGPACAAAGALLAAAPVSASALVTSTVLRSTFFMGVSPHFIIVFTAVPRLENAGPQVSQPDIPKAKRPAVKRAFFPMASDGRYHLIS